MADKMYSWTTFNRLDEQGARRNAIKPGDEVSASDFDSEDEFNELVNIGAIRSMPYPIPKNKDGSLAYGGSPREYALAQVAEMDQEQYASAVTNTFQVPQLEDRAQKAMEESGFDPGDEPDYEAAEKAEKGQESRQALEAQAGKGKGPQLGNKRS